MSVALQQAAWDFFLGLTRRRLRYLRSAKMRPCRPVFDPGERSVSLFGWSKPRSLRTIIEDDDDEKASTDAPWRGSSRNLVSMGMNGLRGKRTSGFRSV